MHVQVGANGEVEMLEQEELQAAHEELHAAQGEEEMAEVQQSAFVKERHR